MEDAVPEAEEPDVPVAARSKGPALSELRKISSALRFVFGYELLAP